MGKGTTRIEVLVILVCAVLVSIVFPQLFCRAEKHPPGIHSCTLCTPMRFGFHMINRKGSQLILGSAEIRVKGLHGTYASPDLILHYTMEHGYRPPEGFITGVLMLETGLPRDQWTLTRGPHWGDNKK